MNRYALCLLLSLLVGCDRPTQRPPQTPTLPATVGTVTRVMDGDTVKFTTSNESELTIRLEGIDAPEKAQRFDSESTQWLSAEITRSWWRACSTLKIVAIYTLRKILGLSHTIYLGSVELLSAVNSSAM